MDREIEQVAQLSELLLAQAPLTGLRLQALDLTAHEDQLMLRDDLRGLVVLGGQMSQRLESHLIARGALVFPDDDLAPIDLYRTGLYTAEELYSGLDVAYAATPDAMAYEWSRDMRLDKDVYATLQRAIHDDQVTDGLDELIAGRPMVGIMGGHAARRGSSAYAGAAKVAWTLASAGLLVATGGGPGLMEAANLGARCATSDALERAVAALAVEPDFADVERWARLGFAVLADLPRREVTASLGIPTWFYGHEPPNVFPDAIAKYFSNALREDGLLARCTAGVIVLPGAAGTVQEIFQRATRLYYGREPLAPLVLVNVEHWTKTLPAWPLLSALGGQQPMAGAIHLVETIDEAAAILTAPAP